MALTSIRMFTFTGVVRGTIKADDAVSRTGVPNIGLVSVGCDVGCKKTPHSPKSNMSDMMKERDRYSEAFADMSSHIGDKLFATLRTAENQQKLQSLLDPIVSHIISRVFPYILLSAILFLILFILTIGTFYMVMRTTALNTVGGGLATATAVTAAAKILNDAIAE